MHNVGRIQVAVRLPLRRAFLAAVALLLPICWARPAAAAELQEGVIPIRVVENRLLARCDVSTPKRRLPGYLMIELDNPCGLQLHNNAANRDGLDADRNNWPITVHFAGFQLQNLWREKGPQDVYNEFTKLHSPKLEETAVIGTLGAAVFAPYHMIVDLERGTITLRLPRERSDDAQAPQEGAQTYTLGAGDPLTWLPLALPDGTPGVIAVGSTRADSVLDPSAVRHLGQPVHKLQPVRLGEHDLTQDIAFRPALVAEAHADRATGVLGLDWLGSVRLEVDRVNRVARIWPNDAKRTPEVDRAFYAARHQDKPQAYAAYLKAHEEGRHRAEAARRWVDRLIETGVDAKEPWAEALKAHVDTMDEDRRATNMRALMETLDEWGLTQPAIQAAELGLEHGRKDKDPDAVHHIHAALGNRHLELGDLRRAWKHLLSAAFGLPEDGRVNLNLGRVYERQGRMARAFSRYVQALIAPDAGPQALAALQRVQPKLDANERFSVDLVERAIGGKGHDFSAPNVWKPKDGEEPKRVVLAEMVTNAAPEPVIGSDLGFHGLITHFETKHVVCVMHHVATPLLEPLVSRASMVRARNLGAGPTVLAVNGVPVARGGGKPRDADKLYRGYRKHVLGALQEASNYKLSGTARIEDGKVRGDVQVTGPLENGMRLHVWLVERGVVYPGASRVVIHRNVLRGELIKGGMPLFASKKNEYTVKLDTPIAEIEQRIDAFLKSQAWRGKIVEWTTRLDPRELRVVAFLTFDGFPGVLQALQIDPKLPEVD